MHNEAVNLAQIGKMRINIPTSTPGGKKWKLRVLSCLHQALLHHWLTQEASKTHIVGSGIGPLGHFLQVSGQIIDLGGIRSACLVLLRLLALPKLVNIVQSLTEGSNLQASQKNNLLKRPAFFHPADDPRGIT